MLHFSTVAINAVNIECLVFYDELAIDKYV